MHKELKAISEYLHEDGSWLRLQAIATQSRADGGLGLCVEGDPLFQALFRATPPKDMAERPETTAELLLWLIRRPLRYLAAVVKHDVAQRGLQGKSAVFAASVLGTDGAEVRWRVLYVLLKKALYGFYFIRKHWHIVASGVTLEELFARCGRMITSAALDQDVKDLLAIDDAALAAKGLDDGCHWVTAATRLTPLIPDASADTLVEEVQLFHKRVSTRMHAQMALGASNIVRTTWLSAEMLSTDPLVARAGANRVRTVLAHLRPDQRTKFEAALAGDATLMHQIGLMADDAQPECVWRKGGRCGDLFQLWADRFAGAPDTVIDCESVHALWQRLGSSRRAIKLGMLNALLKLQSYINDHGGLPSYELLAAHIALVRSGLEQ